MNLASSISLVRGFLCLFFLSDAPQVRVAAILIAALTDFLDGYIARRYNQITSFGTILDPLMDKLFVGVVVGCFWFEGKLSESDILILFLRDISLLFFGGYLFLVGRFKNWKIRSFIAGKLMTTFQFIALLMVASEYPIPGFLLLLLAISGIASLFELIVLEQRTQVSS